MLLTYCRSDLTSLLDVSHSEPRALSRNLSLQQLRKPLPDAAVKGSTQSILPESLFAGKKRSALLNHFIIN